MGDNIASTFAFLCLLFSSCNILSASGAGCHSGDRAVLLAIDKHLGSPEALSTWRAPHTDCCNWDGVSCYNTNRVQGLELQKISGTIPPAIGDLPELRTLTINHNRPNLTGTIPSSITKLKALGTLILYDNSLSGPIPDFLSQLITLQVLDLSKNKFSGSIPPSFSKLNNLGNLALSNNQLTGPIPDFSGSADYAFIDLSHNKLTGPIPKSLVKLGATSVDLSYNKLTGDASLLVGNSGTALNLQRNHLKFDLSAVRFQVTGMFELLLDHNEIYGSIPAQLNDFFFLQKFNVSFNSLCGKIPRGPIIDQFGASSFVHNKCLCGTPLPACK